VVYGVQSLSRAARTFETIHRLAVTIPGDRPAGVCPLHQSSDIQHLRGKQARAGFIMVLIGDAATQAGADASSA
jgi:hypothetical protein